MSGISLKLKLSSGTNNQGNTQDINLTPPGGTRIKLKSSVPTSQDQLATKKTKAGRASKPSIKVIESRKHLLDKSDSEEKSSIKVRVPPKRVKIQVGTGSSPYLTKPLTTPALVFKQKGKPPRRNLGEGYDSEASDREEDPAIEEQFIIRVLDADDQCNYLRQVIAEKKIGTLRDTYLKFLDPDGRRAIFTIRSQMYAATLVDLPCILEAMKSWDKRGWWKSADISQMLLVYAPIKTEAEVMQIPLPSEVDTVTHQYPHGLTPPMQYARKRRFRKRLHKTQIEAMEDAVEKLLKEDEKAIHTTYEIIDPEAEYSRASEAYSQVSSPAGENLNGYYGDEYSRENAGEPEYYNQTSGLPNSGILDDDDADLALEAELEAAMDEEYDMGTPSNTIDMEQNNRDSGAEEEDSGDESLDDDDDDDDDGELNNNGNLKDVDDVEQERRIQEAVVRDDIADLEDRISANVAAQATQSNPILRKRLEDGARKLRAELQLKKSSIGDGED